MTFGFWKKLLNLRLLRSFLKGVHEPVRLLQFILHIIPFRYKFSQMLLSSVHRCHFPVIMFFRLQRYVVSGRISLQNREVFSYLQILFFGFVLLFRLSVLFVRCHSTPDISFFPITCWVSSILLVVILNF